MYMKTNNQNNKIKHQIHSGVVNESKFVNVIKHYTDTVYRNKRLRTCLTGSGTTEIDILFAYQDTIFIIEAKNLISNHYKSNSNIFEIEQEKDVNKILQEGIGKAKGKDFYSEKYESFIKKEETYVETEKEKKYREALEKQQRQINKDYPNLTLIENDTNYLDKEETMVQVVREIDAYAIVYNLPPLEISNSQWDVFFDTIYNFFEKKGIEKNFRVIG